MTSKSKHQPLTFHLLTIFPEIFGGFWRYGVTGRAVRRGLVHIKVYNLRDYSLDGKRVDDRPYGGGPGMVLSAQPIVRVVEKIQRQVKKEKCQTVILSPRGKQFNNVLAERWRRRYRHLILICGRYEGIDARVRKMIPGAAAVSIGPYVLSGGELAAGVIIDAVARRVPGVLHAPDSVEEKRSAGAAGGGIYTRPEVITHRGRRYRVPKVLLSGHHAKIAVWRRKF